ncbi:MAG: VWA domain-containing protein [Oscillospiraceae bacterium]|nr:VWA domain-containing protein [Oscillospiraceae bacterium]
MGSNQHRITYAVDLVFCIDATQSMDHIIEVVKNNALNFYGDLTARMEEKHKTVEKLRIRLIAFRDYTYDGKDAMAMTDFFELPEQAADFEATIRSIKPKGGGDDPEDGLEALAYAMKSKWNTDASRYRHVIVVWSDDGTHKLGFGKKAPNYPKGMPENFEALSDWWGSRANPSDIMNQSSKRLLLFTPDKPGWSDIRENWDKVIQYVSEAGDGLESCDYEQILHAICNSI